MKFDFSPPPADPRATSKVRSRAKQLDRAIAILDQKILDGRRSGSPIPMEELDWDSLDEVILNAAKAARKQ
jgi:hypothetical protein